MDLPKTKRKDFVHLPVIWQNKGGHQIQPKFKKKTNYTIIKRIKKVLSRFGFKKHINTSVESWTLILSPWGAPCWLPTPQASLQAIHVDQKLGFESSRSLEDKDTNIDFILANRVRIQTRLKNLENMVPPCTLPLPISSLFNLLNPFQPPHLNKPSCHVWSW